MYRRNKYNDSCVSGGSGTISYQWQSSQMDQLDGPMQQAQVQHSNFTPPSTVAGQPTIEC
jgi:hypothetical protein